MLVDDAVASDFVADGGFVDVGWTDVNVLSETPASARYCCSETVRGVFESEHASLIVKYTSDRSFLSLFPRHWAELVTKLPPLVHKHELVVSTAPESQLEESAALYRHFWASLG